LKIENYFYNDFYKFGRKKFVFCSDQNSATLGLKFQLFFKNEENNQKYFFQEM